MNNNKIKRILNAHFIEYKEVNGCLLVEDNYTKDGTAFSEWIDITNWSMSQLAYWLGY